MSVVIRPHPQRHAMVHGTPRQPAMLSSKLPWPDSPPVRVLYRQRSGGVILDADADWVSATRSLREAYVSHPELDPAVVGGFV